MPKLVPNYDLNIFESEKDFWSFQKLLLGCGDPQNGDMLTFILKPWASKRVFCLFSESKSLFSRLFEVVLEFRSCFGILSGL